MLHEAGRLDIVRMHENEFFILRRRLDVLAELARPQCAIDERHRDGLALALAKGQAVAAREARRGARGPAELVDHLAFGHRNATERHRKAELLGEELALHVAEANLARERMRAPVAALGRIAEREQKPFV